MRYFQKLLCLLILVLAASFGVGGCVLLYSDFSVQRSRMAAANAAAHAQACTLLQTEILDLQRRGISTGDAALTARVTAQDVPAALWRGDTLVCATLEGLQSLPLGDAATVTVRTENSIYAVYASDLQGGLRLVTAYDLTGFYRDRNAALMRFLLLEAAVLAAASAVTALLARRLTRPLAVLTDAGAQIAAGDYARRTDLHTGDEIEELSRSFDKMADAVQEKIADLEADVQRREDFVGAFTHELKTPMTSIIGYADMLHTMQTDPDEQREAAAAIVHEGRRLEALDTAETGESYTDWDGKYYSLDATYCVTDSLGFVTVRRFGMTDNALFTRYSVTMDSRTGTVVEAWLSMDGTDAENTPLPTETALRSFAAQAGLESLGDWAAPADSPYGCALYSTNGGALITASTHPYTYQDYVGTAPVSSDRWYYSLTLQLRTEDQLPG